MTTEKRVLKANLPITLFYFLYNLYIILCFVLKDILSKEIKIKKSFLISKNTHRIFSDYEFSFMLLFLAVFFIFLNIGFLISINKYGYSPGSYSTTLPSKR